MYLANMSPKWRDIDKHRHEHSHTVYVEDYSNDENAIHRHRHGHAVYVVNDNTDKKC